MKEFWFDSMEELLDKYLDEGMDFEDAYEKASLGAQEHMVDKLSDAADFYYDQRREV